MTTVVLFNKPYGVLSQFRDTEGRSTVAAYVNDADLRIAGRLDRDSEGLLVLTDDGGLAHKVMQPTGQLAKAFTKCYWIQVEGEPSDACLSPIRQGELVLKDGPCLPAKIELFNPPPDLWPREPPIRQRANSPTQWLSITLAEGRNRQVRRMLAAIGYPVLRLIRYRVGSWTLDGIDTGDIRTLTLPTRP